MSLKIIAVAGPKSIRTKTSVTACAATGSALLLEKYCISPKLLDGQTERDARSARRIITCQKYGATWMDLPPLMCHPVASVIKTSPLFDACSGLYKEWPKLESLHL